MSDDRQSRPRNDQDDDFKDALDDLFGPSDTETIPTQSQEPVVVAQPPQAATPDARYEPAPYYPAGSAPSRAGRSLGKTIGIGCVLIIALGFACTIILAVIGLLADADPGASAIVSEPVIVHAATVQPPEGTGTGRESPDSLVPVGEFVRLNADWRAAVIATIPNATDDVLAENQFNAPPEDGRQFYMVTVSVENTGSQTAYFPAAFLFRAVGEAGTEYSTFEDFCGVIPDPFSPEETPPGTTMSGTICWSVPTGEAASLVMRSDAFLGSYAEHYFALSR